MHNVRKITTNLYSVGASDRRLQLFENIHPIQGIGISYNSYLLTDEKTVLFDTVDWAVYRQFECNLEYALAGRTLDYIFITHMEPDHAATLGEVILRYPNVKILASAKAIQMMEQFGFGHVTAGRTEAVKDGESRSFGQHEITFLSAPMVHWPEVMMAFDKTSGALFTSDAFGSFKSLDGHLFADEVDYDRDWIDESRRYYTNIVGKYGAQVQAVFKKLAPFLDNLTFICPIHGLIWRENLDYIMEKYQKWTTYQPEQAGVLIVYGSMYGNTESVADALASELKELGVDKVQVRDVSNTHVSWLIADSFKYSHIVFACATYNLGIYPPMHNYLEDMKALTVRNRHCTVIYNGTWAPKAGDLITSFLENDLIDMTVTEEKLHIVSAPTEENYQEMKNIAKQIANSVE